MLAESPETKFRIKLRKANFAPLNERAYATGRYGYRHNAPVAKDFTLEQILEIIREGDLDELRQLSRYYYRTNSAYRNNIDFLAHLYLYDTMVIPVFEEGKGSQTQIIKAFYNACHFVDALDVPTTFAHITTEWLLTGIYNGILRNDGDKYSIQDLPLQFCRTRFKDFNNLNILEFNITYFNRFTDETQRAEILSTFPEVIQKAWRAYVNNKELESVWVPIFPADGGISFCFPTDQTPLLIASIPELKKLDDAIKREEKRDENELYKLLIQRMPIDKNGELVFQLDEIADIHSSVADMLEDLDTVDVLTTFGETSLENLQDTTAATQSSDRIKKYKDNTWDALGRSELLFNAENSSSLAYSIKKDETLMLAYINVYETWIKYVLNKDFARKGLTFDFEILLTTRFNQADMQQSFFRGAQYGYSKMFAGVALGMKQMDQLSLMNFENEFLKMAEKMVPLQSSYTTSGNVVAGEEKNSSSSTQTTVKTSRQNDITDEGGRPELPDEQKSEKTQANIEAS